MTKGPLDDDDQAGESTPDPKRYANICNLSTSGFLQGGTRATKYILFFNFSI